MIYLLIFYYYFPNALLSLVSSISTSPTSSSAFSYPSSLFSFPSPSWNLTPFLPPVFNSFSSCFLLTFSSWILFQSSQRNGWLPLWIHALERVSGCEYGSCGRFGWRDLIYSSTPPWWHRFSCILRRSSWIRVQLLAWGSWQGSFVPTFELKSSRGRRQQLNRQLRLWQ